MSEYRIDVVTEDDPDRPLHSELFTARGTESAVRKATRITRRHVTAPESQYGDLWVRAADGGTSAEYVDMISIEAA